MNSTDTSSPAVNYRFECAAENSAWRVAYFSCNLAINSTYRCELLLVIDDSLADPRSIMGQRVSLHLAQGPALRSLGGIVDEVECLGSLHGHAVWRVTFVPALALCRQSHSARVFQDKSTLDIVQGLLGPTLVAYGSRLQVGQRSRGLTQLDFRMQFDESDLDFAQRLLAQVGINFGFHYDHELGAEQVVLFERLIGLPSACNLDGESTFPYHPSPFAWGSLETIHDFSLSQRLVSSDVQGGHWDWRLPAQQLQREKGPTPLIGVSKYDPGQYRENHEQLGARIKDTLHRQLAKQQKVSGKSRALGLGLAMGFELHEHPTDELNGRYIVTEIIHEGTCVDVGLTEEELMRWVEKKPRYENRFICVSESTVLLPEIDKHKKRMRGPTTALVCGPNQGQVHVDDHGRVRLRFHWDRDTPGQSPGSCWVRVAQRWAGDGFGTNFIPRVGTEVVVEFLHGDPEQPLVTGCVPNAATQSPFALPRHKYQSGIRTQSSDGAQGHNELRFDDERGQEEVYLHAQNAFTLDVLGSKVQRIGGDHVQLHCANERIEVGGDRVLKISGRQEVQVQGSVQQELRDGLIQKIGPKGWQSTVQGAVMTQSSGGFDLRSDQAGATLDLGDALKVSARSLEIQCGACTLSIDQQGAVSVRAKGQEISIQGAKIKLNSGS